MNIADKNSFAPLFPEQIHPTPSPEFQSPSTLFSELSSKAMSLRLLERFNAFADPDAGGMITRKSLAQAAEEPGRYGATWEDSQLAKEILQRPDLFNRLDKSESGKFDGLIDRQNVQNVIDAGKQEPELPLPDLTPDLSNPFGRPTNGLDV